MVFLSVKDLDVQLDFSFFENFQMFNYITSKYSFTRSFNRYENLCEPLMKLKLI